MAQSVPSTRSAFAVRDFRLLIQARFLFGLGVNLQAVLMGWQMYELTGKPLSLGLIGLVEAIPALSLALISGYVVDRSNPLAILRGVLFFSFLSALILFLASAGLLPGDRSTWIYVAAFLTGVVRGFLNPSIYALIPRLISREVLNVSSAWLTSAIHIASMTGPAIGGFLYAWKGAGVAYGADCLILVFAMTSAILIRHRPHVNSSPDSSPILEKVTSGLRYVFNHQLLLSVLAMDMFAVLFGGAAALFPIFAKDILGTGPTGVGMLRASAPVGALMMSAILIRHPVDRGAGKILLGVVTGYGFCIIGFGLSKSLGFSMALLALSGAFDSVSMVIRSAVVQIVSPDHMRGRIAAVNSIFIGSSNELGAFESGAAASLMGTIPSVVFGGSMTLFTVLATYFLAPRLRKLQLSKL